MNKKIAEKHLNYSVESAKNDVENAKNEVENAINMGDFGMKNTQNNAQNSLKNGIKTPQNGVENAINMGDFGMKNTQNNAQNSLKNGIKTPQNGVENAKNMGDFGMKNTQNNAQNSLKNGIKTAQNGVENALNNAQNGVENALNNAQNGVENAQNNAQNGVENNKKNARKKRFPVKGRLLGGAAVLAVGSIVAKLIGALYRIPLTNILGAEGMGMYQLVFPVYALFMTLSTAGVPTALSRIVAEKRALGEPTKKYLFAAILVLVAFSTIAALITVGLSKTLAQAQGNPSTAIGYALIAPSIIFVGISAGLRGWFQGQMNMFPTAVSNIISQGAKLAFGIGLAVALKPRGLVAAVSGALIGITISEILSTIYLVIRYFAGKNKPPKECLRVTKDEARKVFGIAFPIAFVSILLPLSSFFDSLIIVNVLKWSGAATAGATAAYGLLSGPVSSLINMPIVIIMSLAVVVVPAVSVSRAEHDITSILLKSRLSIKLTYFVGIPCAVFFIVFARQILGLIYPALSVAELDTACKLLMITSANIVFLSAMQIYISLLQALDKTKYAVLSLVIAIIIKIALNVALTKYVGIMGAAIASVAMSVTAMVFVNAFFIKITSLHLEKNTGLNLLVGGIMAIVAYGISVWVGNAVAALVVGFFVSVVLYILLTLMFDVIGKDDLAFMPLGKTLLKIRRVVRFWDYRADENGE